MRRPRVNRTGEMMMDASSAPYDELATDSLFGIHVGSITCNAKRSSRSMSIGIVSLKGQGRGQGWAVLIGKFERWWRVLIVEFC